MIYSIVILTIIISFTVMRHLKKKNRRYKKVKPLSEMTKREFKKTMKDLEIK